MNQNTFEITVSAPSMYDLQKALLDAAKHMMPNIEAGQTRPGLSAPLAQMLNTVQPAPNVVPFPAPVSPPVTSVQTAPVPQMAPPPAVPTSAPNYTHDQIGRAVASWTDRKPENRAIAFDILAKMGKQGITQLSTPDERNAFVMAIRAQGAQI